MPDTALNVAQVLWEERIALARTQAASPDPPAANSEIYRCLNCLLYTSPSPRDS